MKHKNEALAAFALAYILREYEVGQEVEDKVSALFTEVHELTEGDDAPVEEVLQEAIKVLEKFVSKNKVKSTE